MVRNTLKHTSHKHKKAFANDLKLIFHAPDEETGHQTMLEVKEKWDKVYPNAMKRWNDDWSAVCPIFKYSSEVRKAIYTTNAIESLNSRYRSLNGSRSVFPSDDSLKKALYLSTLQITKKWTAKIHNWGMIFGELSIHFEGRLYKKSVKSDENLSGLTFKKLFIFVEVSTFTESSLHARFG